MSNVIVLRAGSLSCQWLLSLGLWRAAYCRSLIKHGCLIDSEQCVWVVCVLVFVWCALSVGACLCVGGGVVCVFVVCGWFA